MEKREIKSDGQGDLLSATSDAVFKCWNCGNMFNVNTEGGKCNVCGKTCSESSCEIVYASNQDY